MWQLQRTTLQTAEPHNANTLRQAIKFSMQLFFFCCCCCCCTISRRRGFYEVSGRHLSLHCCDNTAGGILCTGQLGQSTLTVRAKGEHTGTRWWKSLHMLPVILPRVPLLSRCDVQRVDVGALLLLPPRDTLLRTDYSSSLASEVSERFLLLLLTLR